METPSTNYELLFADDSPINCPITSWTIESTTDSVTFNSYPLAGVAGSDVTLDSVSKLMKVQTLTTHKELLVIKAMADSGNFVRSPLFNIEVCEDIFELTNATAKSYIAAKSSA